MTRPRPQKHDAGWFWFGDFQSGFLGILYFQGGNTMAIMEFEDSIGVGDADCTGPFMSFSAAKKNAEIYFDSCKRIAVEAKTKIRNLKKSDCT